MFSTRSLRALLGAAVFPLLVAALALVGVNSLSSSGEAAGDCSADPALDADEQAFLVLINNHRAQNGLPPLAASYTLSKSAQWKSQDMANNNYFAHDDLTRTWVTRIRDCGYGYNTWLGENIAAGIATAKAAFDLWRNSPGHNANMLGSNYTAVGIGRAYGAGTAYGWYWTTEFGGFADGWPNGTPTSTRTATPPLPTATRTATPPAPTATPTATPPTGTPTASPTAATPAATHVGDLDGAVSGKKRWSAIVTVTVHDASEQPVAGATVSGSWGSGRTSSCVTDAAGRCSMKSPTLSSSTRSVTFTVVSVAKAGASYATASNHDVDGGTNGVTITVAK